MRTILQRVRSRTPERHDVTGRAVGAYTVAMLLMKRLQSLSDQIGWATEQRDLLIGVARKRKFTRKEIAAVTGLSERHISRIADNYDGTAPSERYYPDSTGVERTIVLNDPDVIAAFDRMQERCAEMYEQDFDRADTVRHLIEMATA